MVDEKAAAEEEPENPLDILVFALPTPQPEVVEKPAQATGDEEIDDEDEENVVSPCCLYIIRFFIPLLRHRRKESRLSSSAESLPSRPSWTTSRRS